MKYGIVVASIAVIILVGGGVLWALNNNGNPQNERSTDNAEDSQLTETEEPAENETNKADADITITYTDSGFRLTGNTISAGGMVLVVNQSSELLQFASDPHPQHTDNEELNVPNIEPGEQESFVVNDTGAWGFHNHLNDDHTGTITVID